MILHADDCRHVGPWCEWFAWYPVRVFGDNGKPTWVWRRTVLRTQIHYGTECGPGWAHKLVRGAQ